VKSSLLRSRMFVLLLATALSGGALAGAQAPAATTATVSTPAAATTGNGSFRGHIADQTGAFIPGVDVEIDNSLGVKVGAAVSDTQGVYVIQNLPAGSYIVRANTPGFAPFATQTLQLAVGQSKRVDISMAVEVDQQNVVVTDEAAQVSVDASNNASVVVIKGKDLDALSDDPDELSNELSALAGPSAGPNGGQIYIDGFSGGQLPPKSAIREIRINQNPFSAEFDRLGYGRIEILTKPGTEKLHGRVFMQGNDSVFNTGTPFAKNVPNYYRIQYNATLSGAINKKTSFFLSLEQRDNHDEQVYSYTPAYFDDVTSQYLMASKTSSGSMSNPHNRINVSGRLDYAVSDKNTLTMRYQYYHDSESGDISSTQLPTLSETSTTNDHTLQVSDSQIISDKLINETRFMWRRTLSTDAPVSTAPLLTVTGDFTGGGATGGTDSTHTDHFELQNVSTLSAGRQAIKFGLWARDNREAIANSSNYNGSLTFTENGYLAALNLLHEGKNLSALPTAGTATDGTPIYGLSTLSISAGKQNFAKNVFDAALFFQDDIKVNRLLTLSAGLRWETQNHISNRSNFAPRVAFAYALDGHKDAKQTKTVVRGGFGIFYDRTGLSTLMSPETQGRDSGRVQVTTTDASCLNATSLTTIDWTGCLPSSYAPNSSSTIYQLASNYHSPYTEQAGLGIERQVTKSISATATYLHSFGVHQVVSRDANAYTPGTYVYGAATQTASRPDDTVGVIHEYSPEAVFKQDQLIFNVNAKVTNTFNIMGFYNLSWANTNGAGATASFSSTLKPDYGRAAFVPRNMLFMMATYDTPFWKLRLNPFLIFDSGRPFNIVTSNDLTGDSFMNSRPSFASDSSLCTTGSTRYYSTKYGCLDTLPTTNGSVYKPIPINYGNGPKTVAFNLRVSRNVGIGPKVDANSSNQNSFGGPGGPGGGPRGGGPGGGPGGGLGPGGLGGNRGGPPSPFTTTNRKYTINFSVEAMNLFNIMNYGTPVGTVGATEFGKSTSLAGGPFSSGSSSRRIFAQAVFSF